VKSDPDYADAWAWLSSIYRDEHRFNFNPRPDPLDRALDAARRAVDLDPSSQVAHHTLAEIYFYRHELDGFFVEAERTVALNPNDALTLAGLGDKLHYAGELQTPTPTPKRSSPLAVGALLALGKQAYLVRRGDQRALAPSRAGLSDRRGLRRLVNAVQ
jgi:tetratricopeptide (TPR) repeat protein